MISSKSKQSDFISSYESGNNQLLFSKISADLETPVSIMLKLGNEPFSALFESVEGGNNRSRYSFIVRNPDRIWQCKNGKSIISTLNSDSPIADENTKEVDQSLKPFSHLRKFIEDARIDIPDQLPPMSYGVFGYFGYDMVGYMEDLPKEKGDSLLIPDALFFRPTEVIIFDSVRDELIIVVPVFYSDSISSNEAYSSASTKVDSIIDKINNSNIAVRKVSNSEDGKASSTFEALTDKQEYLDNVLKAKKYIEDGDIFQLVLSMRFRADYKLSPFSLYRALRHLNPSPFLFCMNLNGFSFVGSSPEILVRKKGSEVTIRPIAGTRPRGADVAEDAANAKSLLEDEKELAEHLMLLDLGRNDVGRVAKRGTVSVTEQNIIEYYSHVMHIVSNVKGELKEDLDALDALIAGFPAGTVSGAPKIRAMEIINELESYKRSFYAGCVGYFSANGDMDNCITLRTALVKDGEVFVQAGAGIVADSDPIYEYNECYNKAKAIFKAAELAGEF